MAHVDRAAQELIDLAAQWTRDRAETRALFGAIYDAIVDVEDDGTSTARLNRHLVAEIRKHSH